MKNHVLSWRNTWLSLLGIMLMNSYVLAEEESVQLNQMAPDFALMDQHGKLQKLSAYRGHWLVLYFYPKDDTPGCTKEACQFRDGFAGIKKLGGEILGVSVDNQDSHAQFAKKYNLPFPLLADTDGAVAKQYDALWSLAFIRFARRHSFIVDPQGKIVRIYREVRPETHAQEIIDDLKTLQRLGS